MIKDNASQIINHLYLQLNSTDLIYCTIPCCEKISETTGQGLDLLIAGENVEALCKIIRSWAQESGWNYFTQPSQFDFLPVVIYKIEPADVMILTIRIWTKYSWLGISGIDSDYVLSSREPSDDCYVPRSGSQAAMKAFLNMLKGNTLSGMDQAELRTLAIKDPEGFHRSLKPLGNEISAQMYQIITDSDRLFPELSGSDLKRHLLVSSGTPGWASLIHFCQWKTSEWVKSAMAPAGGLLVFLGPDGSGKTTTIDRVTRRLSPIYPEYLSYNHWFDFLPFLRTKVGPKLAGQAAPPAEPIKTDEFFSPSLKYYTLLWLIFIYRTLEFQLGRLKIWSVARRGGLIIFDRYYYEFFVHAPLRKWTWPARKLLYAIIPKPITTIFLSVSPDAVFSRKQELHIDEIRLQNKYFSRLMEFLPNGHIVNAERPMDEVEAEVCSIILAALQEN